MSKLQKLACFSCLLLLVSCKDQSTPTSATFKSMGTLVTVTPQSILEPTQRIFDRIDAEMNEWKVGSPVAEINRMAGEAPVQCPEKLCIHMLRAIKFAEETNGAFDPTWACMWDLWDFNTPALPDIELVTSRLPLIDWTKVVVGYNTIFLEEKGMAIGLGGFAKGVALDWADIALRNSGAKDYIIQVGGQIFTRGIPRTIGIRKPDGTPSEIIGTVQLQNRSISTTGDYENYFVLDGVRYHHIIDPKTGFPSRGIRSVTVITGSASYGDAMSTALFVMGVDDGLKFVESKSNLQALFIAEDNSIHLSSGFEFEKLLDE